MLLFERMKTQRGEWPKTFEKDHFPDNARTQCWQLLEPHTREYSRIVEILRHAIGVYHLNKAGFPNRQPSRRFNHKAELQAFLHEGLDGGNSPQDIEYALTTIELMAQNSGYDSERAIETVNYRLKLAGVGYKYIDRQLVPVDDEELTNDAVIPAISLLNRDEFTDSYNYLRQAFSDYKEGTNESSQSAIDNTVKAVETALKIIFSALDIDYGPKATYAPLIQIAAENDLFPGIAEDKLSPIVNMLKALGEMRNKGAGHGGPDKKVSDKAVRLAIHHSTANLLYIVESYLERKQ
ncbi:hypothetical protein [Thalassospira lohafexi]|uniref:Abortive infection protein-like C-terminal domain-containing protein n=1 Tax=Thalassospira lohafexi TaxID=744227 RepID=A0A2N3L3A2_9PROT|nr:hypothetical protein [Thalassospira lohafexi]PKR57294.1 hypothetical protein COO92_15165 [Thalassospira lohafexi]